MEFTSYREYKWAKRQFRNALYEEHEKYMQKVYSDIDKAAEIDVRLFWKLTKCRKPKRSQIYPEIGDEEGVFHTDPRGVAETFALFYRKLYTPLEDDRFDHAFRNTIIDKYRHITTECEEDRGIYPRGSTYTDRNNVSHKYIQIT